MSIFYFGLTIILGILFFVTLIEFLTGSETQGMKFFLFLFIFLAVASVLFPLILSKELIQNITKVFASLLNSFSPK